MESLCAGVSAAMNVWPSFLERKPVSIKAKVAQCTSFQKSTIISVETELLVHRSQSEQVSLLQKNTAIQIIVALQCSVKEQHVRVLCMRHLTWLCFGNFPCFTSARITFMPWVHQLTVQVM